MSRALSTLSLATLLLAPSSAFAFSGKVDTVSIQEQANGKGYKVVVIVQDDLDSEVHDVEVQFNEPFEGPTPQDNPLLADWKRDRASYAGSLSDTASVDFHLRTTGALDLIVAEVDVVSDGGEVTTVPVELEALKSRFVGKNQTFDADPTGATFNVTVTLRDVDGGTLGTPLTQDVIVENLADEDEAQDAV